MFKGFGDRMKLRRDQLGFTLKKLGEKSNVSASFLSDIENGKSFPSMTKAAEIANALNIPIAWLLGEDKNEETDNSLINDISKDSIMYDLFLDKHIFPNGLTYKEMNEKIILLKKVQNLLSTNKN